MEVEQVSSLPRVNAAIYKRQPNGSYLRYATYNLAYGGVGVALPPGGGGGGGGGGGQQNLVGAGVAPLGCDDEGDGSEDNPYMFPYTFVSATIFSPFVFSARGAVTPVQQVDRNACMAALVTLEDLECPEEDNSPATNGCGTDSFDVPDHFLGFSSSAGLFSQACDMHDRCYARANASKPGCDVNLGNNMRSACDNLFSESNPGMTLPEDRRNILLDGCHIQAQAYQSGLVAPFNSWVHSFGGPWTLVAAAMPSSQDAYNAAQNKTSCRIARQNRQRYCGG